MSETRRTTIWSAVLAISGLVLCAAGGVSVFLEENGLGSAALMAAGAVLLVAAAILPRIARISYRGASVDLLQEAARRRSEGDDEGADELERVVVEASSREITTAAGVPAYAAAVLGALRTVTGDGDIALPVHPGAALVDAIFDWAGCRIGVDIRAGTRFSLERVAYTYQQALANEVLGLRALLMVVNLPRRDLTVGLIQERLLAALGQQARMRVIGWQIGDPTTELEAAARVLCADTPA